MRPKETSISRREGSTWSNAAVSLNKMKTKKRLRLGNMEVISDYEDSSFRENLFETKSSETVQER